MNKLWIEDSDDEDICNGYYEDKEGNEEKIEQIITGLDAALKKLLGENNDRKINRSSKQVKSTKRTME